MTISDAPSWQRSETQQAFNIARAYGIPARRVIEVAGMLARTIVSNCTRRQKRRVLRWCLLEKLLAEASADDGKPHKAHT